MYRTRRLGSMVAGGALTVALVGVTPAAARGIDSPEERDSDRVIQQDDRRSDRSSSSNDGSNSDPTSSSNDGSNSDPTSSSNDSSDSDRSSSSDSGFNSDMKMSNAVDMLASRLAEKLDLNEDEVADALRDIQVDIQRERARLIAEARLEALGDRLDMAVDKGWISSEQADAVRQAAESGVFGEQFSTSDGLDDSSNTDRSSSSNDSSNSDRSSSSDSSNGSNVDENATDGDFGFGSPDEMFGDMFGDMSGMDLGDMSSRSGSSS